MAIAVGVQSVGDKVTMSRTGSSGELDVCKATPPPMSHLLVSLNPLARLRAGEVSVPAPIA